MAYSANNLNVLIPRVGAGAGGANAGFSVAVFAYRDSSGDNLATMVADNYITDGGDQGVQVGDIIAFVETAVDGEWMIVDTVSAAGLVAVTSFSNP